MHYWNYSCCLINEDPSCETGTLPIEAQSTQDLCKSLSKYDTGHRGEFWIISLAIFIIGIISNLLCIIIFVRGRVCSNPSMKMFKVLSVFNVIALLMNVFSAYVRASVRSLYSSKIYCGMFGLLFLYSRQLSSCTIALFKNVREEEAVIYFLSRV
ncbi:hypothetical protein ACOME3_002342 [Neoechinorhynchus agilis]